jgi:hypothetical protein
MIGRARRREAHRPSRCLQRQWGTRGEGSDEARPAPTCEPWRPVQAAQTPRHGRLPACGGLRLASRLR